MDRTKYADIHLSVNSIKRCVQSHAHATHVITLVVLLTRAKWPSEKRKERLGERERERERASERERQRCCMGSTRTDGNYGVVASCS